MYMVKLLRLSRAFIFNLLFLVYIIQLFISFKQSGLILSICSLFAFLFSLSGLQVFYQLIICLSFSISLIVMYLNDMFTWQALTYFSGMTNILVLLTYSSFFAIPVILGEYPQKIYSFFKTKLTSFKGLYTTFSVVTFIICSVMAASAIPTIQTSLSNFLKKLPPSFVNKFQSITFVRPFIMTLFWTPIAAAPTIAISGTGAKASVVLPITFSLAILLLLLDISTSYFRLRGEVNKEFSVDESDREHLITKKEKTSLLYFLLNFLIFIGLILFISHWFSYSILDSVIMIIIPYSFIWSLTLKKGAQYFRNLKIRLLVNVPQVYPQVALFIAISVLINIIDHSDVSHMINNIVQIICLSIGPFFLLFISFIVFILTWTGIIPQLVVVLVTQTLNLHFMNVSPEWLALAILGGALAGSASSPFTMNANIVAVTINESPMNVVRHNLIFALLIFFVTSFLAVFLQIYFG
ncbi:hypothetical protein SAMN05444673_0767 [Bacillus sp. OV166]|uniref:hypothetical protein n=1 Tax=Bacillus sp. OV166 TaxID=1882763 RepID=UPI000A2AE939|nr:hypothetical protein [Bacillus sp. OV166]SMQ62994.1 hypothetical protein SAMN05444673_0767 [Bacillus sp. OV166]